MAGAVVQWAGHLLPTQSASLIPSIPHGFLSQSGVSPKFRGVTPDYHMVVQKWNKQKMCQYILYWNFLYSDILRSARKVWTFKGLQIYSHIISPPKVSILKDFLAYHMCSIKHMVSIYLSFQFKFHDYPPEDLSEWWPILLWTILLSHPDVWAGVLCINNSFMSRACINTLISVAFYGSLTQFLCHLLLSSLFLFHGFLLIF